ncbi:MAG: TIGR04283 family arsenosugar biosynthesis glycosyltransferase [bacterium]
MQPALSIIVPVLNEARTLPGLLEDIKHCQTALNLAIECVVVDGGSTDETVDICRKFNVLLVRGVRGRGQQLALGAKRARGEVLLFVHADCRLKQEHCLTAIRAVQENGIFAGGFTLEFNDPHVILRFAEMVNKIRFRITRIFYGDHGLFISRKNYQASGGFPNQAIFEDVEFSRRLKKMGKVIMTPPAIETSARRFRAGGVVRTYLKMAALHIMYWLGFSPKVLARWYGVNSGQE